MKIGLFSILFFIFAGWVLWRERVILRHKSLLINAY